MLTEEEIRIKLGLDTTELDSGTRRALMAIANFGKESHKSFLHGDNAGRQFHRTLEKLTDAFPALGYAVRAIVSPVGAAFAAVASGIGLATKAIDEWNKKLEESARINVQRINGPQSEFSDKSEGVRDFYKKRLDAMNEKRSKLQQTDVEGGKSFWVDVMRHTLGYPTHKIAEGIEGKRVSNAREELSLMDEYQRKLDRLTVKKQEAEDFEKIAQRNAEANIKLKEKEVEEEKKLDELDEKRKHNLQERIKAQRNYDIERNRLGRSYSHAETAGYIPNNSDLAGMNTPYGAIAREVAAAQAGSKAALGLANPAETAALRAKQQAAYFTFQKEAGAAYQSGDAAKLSEAYQKYGEKLQNLLSGRTDSEYHLETIADQIKDLNTKASSEGLVVRGAD